MTVLPNKGGHFCFIWVRKLKIEAESLDHTAFLILFILPGCFQNLQWHDPKCGSQRRLSSNPVSSVTLVEPWAVQASVGSSVNGDQINNNTLASGVVRMDPDKVFKTRYNSFSTCGMNICITRLKS